MEGNCTMVMDLVDLSACDNNTLDKIGIVVYRNSGGIWYANNFNISNGTTSPMAILSGCVWVSTSGLTSCIPAPVINNSLTRSTQMEIKPPSQLNVKVYPNPSEHHFTLYLEGANNEKVAIVVYDAIGRQVKKIERGDASGAIKFGEDLKVGVYIVEVRQGDNRKTLKLVKQ
jgi:hypothetical protein